MGDLLDPVPSIGASLQEVPLEEFSEQTPDRVTAQRSMSEALDGAASHALSLPGIYREEKSVLGDMRDRLSGKVGDLKSHLVSESKDLKQDPEARKLTEQMEIVGTAVAGLYGEMMIWNTSWKVAKAAQRDLNHVLKSQ